MTWHTTVLKFSSCLSSSRICSSSDFSFINHSASAADSAEFSSVSRRTWRSYTRFYTRHTQGWHSLHSACYTNIHHTTTNTTVHHTHTHVDIQHTTTNTTLVLYTICCSNIPTNVVGVTMKVNGKAQNLTPHHTKTPKLVITKICTGDYVVDINHSAKFYSVPVCDFLPYSQLSTVMTVQYVFIFLWYSSHLWSKPLHGVSHEVH